MVFTTPRRYLIPAALALVAQQAAASSLYYDPVTTSGTTDEISSKFPARGAAVSNKDCAITVEVDPTLPNITTISTVPVAYPDLLANMTTAPAEAVSTKVGTPILAEDTPATSADQDAYATTTSNTQTSTPIMTSKKGTTVSQTSTSTTGSTTSTSPFSNAVSGSSVKDTTTAPATPAPTTDEEPNCATGWEETKPTRKLRDSAVSGHERSEKLEKKRRLEANANKDIAKLEAYFGTSMEMTLKNLPTKGVHTPSPWPGPYWPTYQDGINVVWSSGEPSAAEKYATAFGLDATDFMDKVSKDNGIDSMSSHTVCSSDSDCSSLTDSSVCGIRAGKSSGYCIPSWYGICHAWTPASMLENEPQCAVTYNGVTFQPLDLKALLSDIYDGASVSTVFTGTRYNGGTDSEDEYGRHSNAAYRDLNPAYFHVAAANLLGNLNATFIADVSAGSEVWNQPVRGFKVYEQTNMTLEEAASTFYGLAEYPWNSAAKSIVYVKTRLSWIFETYTNGPLVSTGKVDSYTTGAYYTYLLEMDDAGAIIGGEWVYDSDDDHPDFLWFPKAKPAADTVTSIGLSYADVTMLLEQSVACTGSASGSESAGSASDSASASSEGHTSGSVVSSSAGSAASGSARTSSSEASTAGSGGAVTVAPVTEAPATETPTATLQSSGTPTTAPASTTATPTTTTATPATTATPSANHGDKNKQQQDPKTWQSYLHWW